MPDTLRIVRFLCLCACLSAFHSPTVAFSQHSVSVTDWQQVAIFDDALFAPHDLRLLPEVGASFSALLLDTEASDQHLAQVRLDDGMPIHTPVSQGQGPGEVSGRNMSMSLFSNGDVLLWDHGRRKALIFDRELQYENEIRGLQQHSPRHVYLVNDSTLAAVVSSPETLVELYRLSRSGSSLHVDGDPITTVDTDSHPVLADSEIDDNMLLRQGRHQRVGDQLVYAFNYSSILLAISEEGNTWITDDPLNHELPSYDYRDGNTVTAPAAEDFEQGYLSLTGDGRFIYALYSGQKAELRGPLSRVTRGAIAEQMERIMHSDRMLVFDRASGAFITETTLPMRAKAIDVRDGYLGLITHERSEPTIAIYHMPDTW